MRRRSRALPGLCLLALAAGCAPAVHTAPNVAPASSKLDALNPHALRCGPAAFCDVRTSYCETIKTDVAALPSTYTCKPLPASCKASSGQPLPSCGCFPPGTRGDMCSTVDRGGTPGFWRTTVGGR